MKPETLSILLLEDDDVDAMMVERVFAKAQQHCNIVRAVNGLVGLEKIRCGDITKPFIVLLDLNMPQMNGLEFLAALRANESTEDVVVFVLTTSQKQQDIARSYQFNVAGYFLKSELTRDAARIVGLLQDYWQINQFPEPE